MGCPPWGAVLAGHTGDRHKEGAGPGEEAVPAQPALAVSGPSAAWGRPERSRETASGWEAASARDPGGGGTRVCLDLSSGRA